MDVSLPFYTFMQMARLCILMANLFLAERLNCKKILTDWIQENKLDLNAAKLKQCLLAFLNI